MADQIKWKDEILCYFNNEVKNAFLKLPTSYLYGLNEIRISSKGYVSFTVKNSNYFLKHNNQKIRLSKNEIENIFSKVCSGCVHKYENQIRNGYITVPGGHRVGFCGTAVYEKDELLTVKNISSISFRISRQIKNAAREIIGNIISGETVCSALIVGEPCGGKTTILTDLARLLSNSGKRCAVIDERGEICSCYEGTPQKDIGELTCVFDGYTKGEGMMIALRTMSPQVIICDEVGNSSDADAMLEAMNAGVPVIATAHATNEDELLSRPQIEEIIDCGAIDKLIFLKGPSSPGSVKKVILVNKYDEDYWNSSDCS